MAKERIIIADTDINYLISIQLKFAEELFERADIEVITDKNYFQELFSRPQQAQILIVSEDLYEPSLHRHNISHIFLMSEKNEEDETVDLKTTVLYKYTSVKEIYHVIMGKSSIQTENAKIKSDETQIILVYSVNGGVGKSTIATGISACLAKNYKRVLYINASHLQSFPNFIENTVPIPMDVTSKLKDNLDDSYQSVKHVIRKEVFSYLPPFKLALMSLDISYHIFHDIALSAKKSMEYDFIIIDADSTFDDEKAQLLNIADRVILITNQTKHSVVSMNLLTSNINGSNGDKYMFLCNNFEKQKENALISPYITVSFTVSEYIEHFRNYEQMNIEQLSKESSLQKAAYLII
ncbi:MAG: AAA family ATPase [Erysipelotrichaceae bacterium]|nr:AAA family ATPase [Erysipelotrichaceae bacterium]